MADNGTKLYQEIIGREGRSKELMRKVWSPTPWIVNVYTGGNITNPEREEEIRTWCGQMFGPESYPIQGLRGNWRRGDATINGYTWMGFATKEMMDAFVSEWPNP